MTITARFIGGPPIEDDRVFGWMAPDYDDSTWAAPITFGAAANNVTPAWQGIAGRMAGDTAEMIWATGTTTALAPGGWCYFRKRFTVTTAVRARITFVADDIGELYLDGQSLIVGNQWTNQPGDVASTDVDLDATTHTLAVVVQNSLAGPAIVDGAPFNPAMLACSVRPFDALGNLGAPLAQTEGPVFDSDTGWMVLAYPATPPGLTPGQVLTRVLAEAHFRGALAGISGSWSDTVDSAGTPWPVVASIGTRVGNDVTTFVREMTDTYIDVAMDPATLTLHAYVKGTIGTASSAAYHAPTDPASPASGNLGALKHTRVA